MIEQVMRYFYGLGVHGAKNKAPIDDVQKCFNKAPCSMCLTALSRAWRQGAAREAA
jgi:hypothetical protein